MRHGFFHSQLDWFRLGQSTVPFLSRDVRSLVNKLALEKVS